MNKKRHEKISQTLWFALTERELFFFITHLALIGTFIIWLGRNGLYHNRFPLSPQEVINKAKDFLSHSEQLPLIRSKIVFLKI